MDNLGRDVQFMMRVVVVLAFVAGGLFVGALWLLRRLLGA